MKTIKLLGLFLLFCSLWLPMLALAQGGGTSTSQPVSTTAATDVAPVEPTDRPFPGAAATALAEPTSRPFPATANPSVQPTGITTSGPVDAKGTPVLADVQATAKAAQAQITLLEAERDTLRKELEVSRADNGATTFALVIIVVGVLLAFAVFFGLRRGSN